MCSMSDFLWKIQSMNPAAIQMGTRKYIKTSCAELVDMFDLGLRTSGQQLIAMVNAPVAHVDDEQGGLPAACSSASGARLSSVGMAQSPPTVACSARFLITDLLMR